MRVLKRLLCIALQHLRRLAIAAVEQHADGFERDPLVIAAHEGRELFDRLCAMEPSGRLDFGRHLVRRTLLPTAKLLTPFYSALLSSLPLNSADLMLRCDGR